MPKFFERNKVFLAIIIAGFLISNAIRSLNGTTDAPRPENLTAKVEVGSLPDLASDNRKENIPATNSQNDFYKVAKVVDGDTIAVDISEKIETVRLIGIDAPEVVGKSKTVECLGKLASNKAKEILTGKSVKLEADQSQGERDKYGRLLRYIFLENGTDFNKMMVKEGFAKEYTYKIPYKYQSPFKKAEKEAKEKKMGLWSLDECESLP